MGLKTKAAALLGLVLGVVILTRLLFPKTVTVQGPPLITRIVDTVHDTVTVRLPPAPAPGAPNLVIRETHHDVVTIVPPGPALKPVVLVVPDTTRPRLYPVLSILVGPKVGDTTYTQTFGLQRGDGVRAAFWTPGPLLEVTADSSGTPRIRWGDPPAPGCEFGCKVKLVATGGALGALAVVVARAIFSH